MSNISQMHKTITFREGVCDQDIFYPNFYIFSMDNFEFANVLYLYYEGEGGGVIKGIYFVDL